MDNFKSELEIGSNKLYANSAMKKSKHDFIVDLFNSGCKHVLHRIFLDFPLNTLINCQKVSPDWKNIVLYLNDSKNARIQKIKNVKIMEEWWRNKPTEVYFNILRHLEKNFYSIVIRGLVTDDKTVVVLVEVKDSRRLYGTCHFLKILIFDSMTLSLAYESNLLLEFTSAHSIHLILDNNFLYIFTYLYSAITANKNSGRCFIYALNDEKKAHFVGEKTIPKIQEKTGLSFYFSARLPYVHNGRVHVPHLRSGSSNKLTLEIWDIAKGKEEKEDHEFPFEDWYLCQDGSKNFFSCVNNVLQFHVAGNKTPKWTKETRWGISPAILGSSNKYVAVLWRSHPKFPTIVEVYRLENGSVALSYESAEFHQEFFHYALPEYVESIISCKQLEHLVSAQFAEDLLLIPYLKPYTKYRSSVTEKLFFDLTTGKLITSFSDPSFSCKHGRLAILKIDRVLLANAGISCFKFWI